MVVAIAASLVGLATVLFALYRDREVLEGSETPAQDWDGLPVPADISRQSFPLAFRGYDTVAVEAHLDAVAIAYGELLAVVTPEQRDRARRNAARRAGRPLPAPGAGSPTGWMPGVAKDDQPQSALPERLPERPASATGDALRLEAALAAIPDEPHRSPRDSGPSQHQRSLNG
jgi:DivIVA domain-containing protein